jgi:NADPH-dependent curcumin reductase CurA
MVSPILSLTVDIFPDTLLRLFRGDNFGKLMIKLPE